MKVIQLVKHGDDPSCFKITDTKKPEPEKDEVLIRVQAFGLNYADVMARKGLYRDAPPLPSVLGYDVVGIIENVGDEVNRSMIGKKVVAITEFGGYAEYAVTHARAVVELEIEMPYHAATALATQYATAWYAAHQLGNVQKGDHVFIHAAAGGVGLALIQLCKRLECVIYGSVSNDQKASLIRDLGVQHVINSSEQNVYDELQKLEDRLDVIFDAVGGKGVKFGIRALRAGGRIICYGGSKLAEGKGVINLVRFGLSFGFYSPIMLLSQSKSILGLNMLKLMRSNPRYLDSTLSAVMNLLKDKQIAQPEGETFPVEKMFEAHMLLQSRRSIGKIAVKW